MIKPVLCGSQQSYLINKKESHGLLRSVQKSINKSQGSNQSSQTKEKRSLKCVTNKQTKPMISSQFKKQAQQSDIRQRVKDQASNQKINDVSVPDKEKGKVPINSYFSLNQNRRKFQSLSNRPLLNTSQNKNTSSQHSYFLNKPLVNNTKSVQKLQIKQKPEQILLIKKQQKDYKYKKFSKEQSQSFKTQKQKKSKVSFLNKYFHNKPNITFDQNNKYSLKPHFSVANFKSSQHQYLKNSKSIESLNNSQQRRPFLRSTLKFDPKQKNQGFYGIKTQRENGTQKQEKSNFLPYKKTELTLQQRRQRISTEGSQKVIQKNQEQRNQNMLSMSRFFSLKTSRFFIPKKQQIQKPQGQQKNQKNFEFTNLEHQIINQDSQVSLKNFEQKNKDLSKYYVQNTQQQIQLEKKSNQTDSTKVSTFFDINRWKKRQIQNRFTSENDSFMQSKFGFNSQSITRNQKHPNFVNSKLKSRVSEDNFVFFQNQLENSKSKLSNDEKPQKILTNFKRNTINHQPSIQNFTSTRNSFIQGSFINKNLKLHDNQDNCQAIKQNEPQSKGDKLDRNANKRPSFFVDLQRKKEQQKTFKKQLEKVILERDEQQNLQSDQAGMFSNIEIKDAQSVVDSEFNSSQKDSELQFVLHSTDKIQLKSFALLNTLQFGRKNFFKYK